MRMYKNELYDPGVLSYGVAPGIDYFCMSLLLNCKNSMIASKNKIRFTRLKEEDIELVRH